MLADALKIGADIADHGATLSKEYRDAADKTESEAKDSASLTVALAAGVGIVSLLIGLAISFLLTRSIRQPIVALTKAMDSLAKGDLTVTIPSADAPNEIGEMARSVEVFKENGLERVRLETEAAASRAAAEAERERTAAERAKAAQEQAEAVRRLGEGLKTLAAGDLTMRLGEGFSERYAQIRE